MRSLREHNLDRAVCLALSRMGEMPLREDLLIDGLRIGVAPPALRSEAEGAILHLESRGFLVRVPGEVAPQVTLTAAGRAWWAQHQ